MDTTELRLNAKEGQIYNEATGQTLAMIAYFNEENKEHAELQTLLAAAPEMFRILKNIADNLAEGRAINIYEIDRLTDSIKAGNVANSNEVERAKEVLRREGIAVDYAWSRNDVKQALDDLIEDEVLEKAIEISDLQCDEILSNVLDDMHFTNQDIKERLEELFSK